MIRRKRPVTAYRPSVVDSYVPKDLATKTFASSSGATDLHGYTWREQFWFVPDRDLNGRCVWTVVDPESGRVVTWHCSLTIALLRASRLVTSRTAGNS
ncbi:MAG TPA: hypothetical protein VGQ75_10320 [Thermoanaerobaculia bacterium]|nr:hypothetical protein [Thermoanaerobaculia bacterium]HEV8608852.1 hypothetical protein [Thermoanaerobaculia bacterium]